MKTFLAAAMTCLLAVPAMAYNTPKWNLGLDFEMPYSLRVDGTNAQDRGNLNLGIDGRYWASESLNYGVRFAFDVEKRGTTRAMFLMPGVQYHWMPTEVLSPFVRLDLPVILRGAAAPTNNKMDVGITAGAGLAWHLGQAIGVEHMTIRYDFGFNYFFGLGDAFDVLSLNIFKIGFDYGF